ncbi:acyltransferase family protein [Nonomuraea jiangxiensis]|uniref:Acyltransferase family protein n=1 Tax=Nonomuraea jiangxiensis TaxID=633440 RepID=A0A1G9ABJ4_9ACTN|nr:acyltransferase [Nonomuraea jiangxiensis]SDK24194.1 Acyltransferase family protein [Nonomuraea jiangxiensis]
MATRAGRGLIELIDAGTPAGRDRGIDGLRAIAVLGVVLGHWLVTALVVDGDAVRVTSPLRYLPQLTPFSWLFQTLAVFFLVGGMVAARSQAAAGAGGYRTWLRGRMARLFRPVAVVLLVWGTAAVAMIAGGVPVQTVRALAGLVWSPLWFLLVFAVLTAATPLVVRMRPEWPFAVVLLVDLIRYGLDGPAWLGWVNVLAGWLVPYCLGATGTHSRRSGWLMLAGGATATAALVLWAGYPASMVGVPGATVSNLDPPTLASVTFGLAQCGAAVLLLDPLRRLLRRRPAAWAAVALVNLSAITIFLWHQTAMIAVSAVGRAAGGPLPGLHTVPDGLGWVAARLGWLPVFAVALAACWAVVRGRGAIR